MNKSAAPQIISLSTAELEKLLGELRGPLAPTTYQLVEALLRTLQWVMAALEQKTASLARLRRMIFGEKTEKACKILPATLAAILSGPAKPKAKGHGRKGAKDYPAAQRVQVPHPKHKVGDLCPKCLKAKLYRFLTPARRVAPVSLRSGKKPHRGGFSAVPRGRAQETGWERKLISQPLPAAAMAC
jgi:hypothetical protein